MWILNRPNPILKDIYNYFGFLFDKWYKIRSTDFKGYGMLSWSVIFESSNCIIEIYKEQNEIHLTFAPLNAIDGNSRIKPGDQISIQPMVYYLTKGDVFIGLIDKEFYQDRKKQFERFSKLLAEYLDRIAPYFGNYEFQMYKSELMTAQDKYNTLLIKKYVHNDKRKDVFS